MSASYLCLRVNCVFEEPVPQCQHHRTRPAIQLLRVIHGERGDVVGGGAGDEARVGGAQLSGVAGGGAGQGAAAAGLDRALRASQVL